jgi:hypothetical protein
MSVSRRRREVVDTALTATIPTMTASSGEGGAKVLQLSDATAAVKAQAEAAIAEIVTKSTRRSKPRRPRVTKNETHIHFLILFLCAFMATHSHEFVDDTFGPAHDVQTEMQSDREQLCDPEGQFRAATQPTNTIADNGGTTRQPTSSNSEMRRTRHGSMYGYCQQSAHGNRHDLGTVTYAGHSSSRPHPVHGTTNTAVASSGFSYTSRGWAIHQGPVTSARLCGRHHPYEQVGHLPFLNRLGRTITSTAEPPISPPILDEATP